MSAAVSRCPRCHAGYRPGQARCASCGWLLEAVTAETMPAEGLPELGPHGPVPQSQKRFELEVADGRAVLFRGTRAQRIPVGDRPLLIGRRDPRGGTYPDIDLHAVADYGYTSRRHAIVRELDGRLLVVDLKGLKTTAVNDLQNTLPGGQPAELRDGDRLIIGEAVTFVVHEGER